VAPDLVSQSLAGAATDNDDVAFFEFRHFDKLCRDVHGIRLDLFNNILVVNFVSNSCHFKTPAKIQAKDSLFCDSLQK
jgi:hypothetical protein